MIVVIIVDIARDHQFFNVVTIQSRNILSIAVDQVGCSFCQDDGVGISAPAATAAADPAAVVVVVIAIVVVDIVSGSGWVTSSYSLETVFVRAASFDGVGIGYNDAAGGDGAFAGYECFERHIIIKVGRLSG